MRRRPAWWMATALAGASLLLVTAEAVLALSNQASASRLAVRRAFIEQTIQLSRVTQMVASAIAGSAASDEALRTVLTRNGFTVEVNPTSGQVPK